jgi:hypothetical protein
MRTWNILRLGIEWDDTWMEWMNALDDWTRSDAFCFSFYLYCTSYGVGNKLNWTPSVDHHLSTEPFIGNGYD